MPEIGEDFDDSMDDFMIFPITDIDTNNDSQDGPHDGHDGDDESYEDQLMFERSRRQSRRPSITLRQRRYSKLGFGNGPLLKLNTEVVAETPLKVFPKQVTQCMSPGRRNWLKALHLIRSMKDPWERFTIENLPSERAIRHRYHAMKKQWKEDEVMVKMEDDPFNHGAMRSCFRLKKCSSFSKKRDWKRAMNYVAKSYMEDVDRDVYFEDVKLQMDAKLWGEEYDRHNPPKKVDIFQMYVLEFIDRPGRPLYHLEHFIEGDYIKYNSNSGFVDENLRLTPQAFSHFTFERSGHELIVVDIQGVGDLWTDPQIHTKDGKAYGDGNLGPKGCALFFHSHVCNSICESLNLTKFDLAPSEVSTQIQYIKTNKNKFTMCRKRTEMVISASPAERSNLTDFLMRSRSRTMSCSMSEVSDEYDSSRHSEDDPMTPNSPMQISPIRGRRIRFLSESDDSASATMTEALVLKEEEDRIAFRRNVSRGARPSCVAHEINLRNLQNFRRSEDSVLGQIHHELAKYHEMGRFNKDVLDTAASLFHEQQAADLGIKEAILTLANLYLGIQQDVLTNVVIESSEDNTIQGVDYMIMAAEVGDRSAMIFMAKAFETGIGLGSDRSRSYEQAMNWYQRAVNMTHQDDSGEFDATMDDPLYQLQAKMAELYMMGGFGLEQDPSSSGDLYNEAAEGAIAAMKGRLANKYYCLAEEAYALVEEE